MSGIALLSPFLAAWLAVKWSLRRFRSEKWWELQSDAYKQLLENLAIVKHCVERELNYSQHPEVMLGPSGVLEEQFPQALAELHKVAAVGPLYISEGASEALEKFSNAFGIDFGEGMEGDMPRRLEAAKQCLKIVRKEAEIAKKSMLR
jgi:hypothetical protein